MDAAAVQMASRIAAAGLLGAASAAPMALVSSWRRGYLPGIVALMALAWAILGLDGIFWNAVVAAGLAGVAIATTLVVRSRRLPTLAQMVTSAVDAPATSGSAR